MNKILEKRCKWFEAKAKELGIDFFPIHWEVVPEEVMNDVAGAGLPTRFRHWSHGQGYKYQKMTGEMGLSKIYEVIFNNDPSYAFLLETNSDIANTMVIAHCVGHSAVFKQNYLFKQTDRQMVYHAAERAARVDEYIGRYGLEAVEQTMDIALSIEKNIDWNKGLYRDQYPKRQKIMTKRPEGEFSDLIKNKGPSSKEEIIYDKFPPAPEYDLLWFLINYSPVLDEWQKDILQIIREESFYFYPQYITKILNEGYACVLHTELMCLAGEDLISPGDYLEFLKIHEKVVQPGGNPLNINPYFLGFTILCDIRKRWDDLHAKGKSNINGWQKMIEVISEEDDISFLQNYLTQEICEQLQMFTYKHVFDQQKNEYIEIESKKAQDIIDSQVIKLYNYKAPLIAVTDADSHYLYLEHTSTDLGTLDIKHIEKVLRYMYTAWARRNAKIDLRTVNGEGKKAHLVYDGEKLQTYLER